MQHILAKPLNPLRNICIFYCSSVTSVTIRSTIMLENIINLHVIFVPSQAHKKSCSSTNFFVYCLVFTMFLTYSFTDVFVYLFLSLELYITYLPCGK